MNSHDCVIPFCGFSAESADELATRGSMCRNDKRQQQLQANVDLRENNTVPSDKFNHPKSRLSKYKKRHCYRATSSIEAPRTQYSDEESGETSQIRYDNDYIPTPKNDWSQAFDIEKQPSGCSIGMQSECNTHSLFPH